MTTPLRRQYLDIKRRYPHAIVFFRLGDFYETFDEDAETVARELEITLTSRPVSKGERVPLAGVPHHSLESHLGKLISRGYKVAICEQVEQAKPGTKLVDRRVVRVVTPGTLIEDNLLPGAGNNYLAAMVQPDGSSGRVGLAYADVSTGEFRCMEVDSADLGAELERIRPAELLVAGGSRIAVPEGTVATQIAPFDREESVTQLLRHFNASALDGLGLEGSTLAAAAAGLIIGYVSENQTAALGHITRITLDESRGHMAIDGNTRRNLELFAPLAERVANGKGASPTLVSVLDATKTPMGARLLRRWLGQPLLEVDEIRKRQEQVGFFHASAVRRGQTLDALRDVSDLERSMARVASAASTAPGPTTARDLLGLRRSLEGASRLKAQLEAEVATAGPDEMNEPLSCLHLCLVAVEVIALAINEDPQAERAIRSEFSEELDGLRSAASDARRLVAEIESRERERTGVKSLKVGFNRVFGYYIEVSKANARSVPEDYQRKQTLVGGERYTTPQLQELEYKILHSGERQEELERDLLRQVCAQVSEQAALIMETAAAVAHIDVCCALAKVAARHGYVRPTVDDSDTIAVRDGRHPVVERVLPDGSFVPNDIDLSSSETQVVVLTGPNMAGKSTYLRQVALIVLLAQVGSFVPAAEARIGVVDRLFSRVGALDDIATGRSTFMVEMLETASILHNATPRSLLIFDEIGRGTSTYDGMAIARAVVEFVHNRPDAAARCLFATHYHELTELSTVLPRVRNYNVAVTEEQGNVVFLHRILPGGADRSYGVHVAQLAGLPSPVVLRAQEILEELERGARRPGVPERESPTLQLAMFSRDDALARDIAQMEVDSMSPLQAITKLYELVERARRHSNGRPGI